MGADSGGRPAIERLVRAYGYKSRQALSDHLGVSKSTMANRYLRDSFPADWIIQCHLETGASLLWLSTGQGEMFPNGEEGKKTERLEDIIAPSISRVKLSGGKLNEADPVILDSELISKDLREPLVVDDGISWYLLNAQEDNIQDGLWLVDIEGMHSIKKIAKIPVSKIRVSDDDVTFDCAISDIQFIGRVTLVISRQ
ncbi:phage repressor protein CI [Xenorhabdus budapestensis]|uniref:Helix-turn-helix domain-containing protein n=2 Tax=Xenorhabdus budapestensis TaxID=290110 RepID=A0A2D0ITE3_XENBU|nr:phage repressor protein CI [Xenorhabdus budapestensis]PHM25158.1 phage repressor protein [Xenorhabdus budapestensis]QTL41756.1 helix-turn-helix domain-containing protein [Xenorhabdus budapestensis]